MDRFYRTDDSRGIIPQHREKLRDILARLDAINKPEDMDIPGLRLHALHGRLQRFWSVTVRANWRIILRIENGNVWDVDYLDYH